MSLTPPDFDPLAIVVDWLDACRVGDLDALLDMYDERATVECGCEKVSLTGRASLSAYWSSRLERRSLGAFALEDMAVTQDGVMVDYRDYASNSVRIHFRFNSTGQIMHTNCGPAHQRLSA
jgi:ketosteroid isomerase-like protein